MSTQNAQPLSWLARIFTSSRAHRVKTALAEEAVQW